MRIYKATLRTDSNYIVFFVIIVLVFLPMSFSFLSNYWFFLVPLIVLFVLFNLITLRLREIALDKESAILAASYKNYVGNKKKRVYALSQIEFTYKRQATSFRSGVKNICNIYHDDKIIIQLVPDNDNWSDYEIRMFVYGLIEVGVKRKFIGYSLKDVEL